MRWMLAVGDERVPPAQHEPDISAAAVLVWEEHCVECAMPECYATCPLYVPRRDRKCARFEYGIYPNRDAAGLLGFGADITFRRWAKLEAQFPGRPQLVTPARMRRLARRERLFEGAANFASDILAPVSPRRRFNGLVSYVRARNRRGGAHDQARSPDAFLVKFYSPSPDPGELIIEAHQDQLTFRTAIPFTQGWTERAIPFEQLRVDPSKAVRLFVAPANDRIIRLVFSWLDLVVFREPRTALRQTATAQKTPVAVPAAKVKCVVWDLDNTLWRGTIGDLGPEHVEPSSEALALIRSLDERGIVQSVASKNDHDVAWPKIEQLGLGDYFLYPAIHWGPKSQSLAGIAGKLNIGIDTFAFIDDSPFERGEVASALPQVRTFDAAEIDKLLDRPEFDVQVTEASRIRRLSYLAEATRQRTAATWGDDYDGFLRSCGMTMRVGAPRPEQTARCLELIKRTNQLNLSSKRYDEDEFHRLLADRRFECFAFDCADRFGQYGLVGFASIDVQGSVPVVRDFVLSCRVAQKRVEEAFIFWYGHRARQAGRDSLRVAFVPSGRNRPLRDALGRLPLRSIEGTDDTELFEMPLSASLETPDVVRIEAA